VTGLGGVARDQLAAMAAELEARAAQTVRMAADAAELNEELARNLSDLATTLHDTAGRFAALAEARPLTEGAPTHDRPEGGA
jgi:hypothetical protein